MCGDRWAKLVVTLLCILFFQIIALLTNSSPEPTGRCWITDPQKMQRQELLVDLNSLISQTLWVVGV